MRVEFCVGREASVLWPIATQTHGNESCCAEVSIPWVCVEKSKSMPGPRCHANIHAVRSEVKSTVAEYFSCTCSTCMSCMARPVAHCITEQPIAQLGNSKTGVYAVGGAGLSLQYACLSF